MNEEINRLQNMIDECENIVFFGGAGVSTDSGIKDFRSKDGLYNEKYGDSSEYMLSNKCFYNETEKFYDFYKKYLNPLTYEPNITHKYLADLEKNGKLKAIITQNIDGLHQKAGSKKVLEIHGTSMINHCLSCLKEYDADYIFNSKEKVPKCSCGGIIKPDVVLYGEMLPESFDIAQYCINKSDMLIVAGTSLTVFPAKDLINLFNGKYLVIINKDKTKYDYRANLVINENLSQVFSKLK